MPRVKKVKGKQKNTNKKSSVNNLQEAKKNSSSKVQTPIQKFAVSVSELRKSQPGPANQPFSPGNFEKNVKERRFSQKQTKSWKTLHESTQDYVSECLETGVRAILNKATHQGLQIDGMQEILTETVDQRASLGSKGKKRNYADCVRIKDDRIKDQLKTLKAPVKTYGNIKKITQDQRFASEQSRIFHDHEEILEESVKEEEDAVRQCEKELKRLQQSQNDKKQLHPFLTDFTPQLDIPPIT